MYVIMPCRNESAKWNSLQRSRTCQCEPSLAIYCGRFAVTDLNHGGLIRFCGVFGSAYLAHTASRDTPCTDQNSDFRV